MEFLTNWVTNIVFFVLLAIIIDLLLPNSNIQRYSKMVIGLLLIVIILNPIMKLFNSDLEEILSTFKIPTIQEKKEIENLVENKKKEIQASQRAYILEQMAVQMKSMVEEELMKEYRLQVESVDVQFAEDKEQLSQDDLQIVNVIVKRQEDSTNKTQSIAVVKDITIDTTVPLVKDEENEQLTDVQAFLAENWQIEKNKVNIMLEGGEM